VAQQFSKKYNCTVVLKGARTVIATPKGDQYVNSTGNAALATAGSGDVLTGMMVSLLGQGMPMLSAVQAAVFTHGLLADRWVEKKKTTSGMMASDLIAMIPRILAEY